jgi:hypothetical protein
LRQAKIRHDPSCCKIGPITPRGAAIAGRCNSRRDPDDRQYQNDLKQAEATMKIGPPAVSPVARVRFP